MWYREELEELFIRNYSNISSNVKLKIKNK